MNVVPQLSNVSHLGILFQEKKKIQNSWNKPASPVHMSTIVTTELQGLSLQDSEAQIFENA